MLLSGGGGGGGGGTGSRSFEPSGESREGEGESMRGGLKFSMIAGLLKNPSCYLLDSADD